MTLLNEFRKRDKVGTAEYGRPLTLEVEIGFDYALEEALDLAVYLKYFILENEGKPKATNVFTEIEHDLKYGINNDENNPLVSLYKQALLMSERLYKYKS